MAGKWRQSTWGEELSLEYGKALRDYKDAEGQYRVYGSNGPVGWTSKPLAPGPGIILGRKGAYRGVEYSKDPFFVIDTAYYVKPKTKLHMRWLYYSIIHHKLGKIDDGSPIPSTTRSAVYVRDLDVPPLDDQRTIAHILGSLDDKIELNRRINETLEAMAAAVFKSWFVDFDPVHAKAQGRDPGLPKEIADLFPDTFEDSNLGPIPKGWKVAKIGSLVDTISDTYPLHSVSEVVFLNTGDIHEGRFLHRNKSDVSSLPGQAKKSIKRGDILYSEIRPKNKRFAFVHFDSSDYVVSTKLMVLRARGNINALFTYFVLKQQSTIDFLQMMAESRSGTFPQITFKVLSEVRIVLPSSDIRERFIETTLKPFFEKKLSIEKENELLGVTRDTLLPKLISGELELSAIKYIYEEYIT